VHKCVMPMPACNKLVELWNRVNGVVEPRCTDRGGLQLLPACSPTGGVPPSARPCSGSSAAAGWTAGPSWRRWPPGAPGWVCAGTCGARLGQQLSEARGLACDNCPLKQQQNKGKHSPGPGTHACPCMQVGPGRSCDRVAHARASEGGAGLVMREHSHVKLGVSFTLCMCGSSCARNHMRARTSTHRHVQTHVRACMCMHTCMLIRTHVC